MSTFTIRKKTPRQDLLELAKLRATVQMSLRKHNRGIINQGRPVHKLNHWLVYVFILNSAREVTAGSAVLAFRGDTHRDQAAIDRSVRRWAAKHVPDRACRYCVEGTVRIVVPRVFDFEPVFVAHFEPPVQLPVTEDLQPSWVPALFE